MLKYLMIIVLLCISSAQATESVYIHISSSHLFTDTIPNSAPREYINGEWVKVGAPRQWNETNLGIAYAVDRYEVGIYHNSEYNISTYVDYKAFTRANYGAKVGLVTGYEGLPIMPLVAGYYEYNDVRLTFIPAGEMAVVGLSIKY